MSKAKAVSLGKTSSFRLHLKDADLTAADALSQTQGRRLGRTAEAARKAQEDASSKGYEQGREEGYSRGYELGMLASDQCKEHIEQFLQALHEAVERVDSSMEDWYKRSEEQLGHLGVVIAAHIIGKEISNDPQYVLPFVREALKEVAIADRIRIRVNPFDSDAVKQHQSELLSLASSVERVEIVNDPSIHGGCLVESDAGAIDATIRTKLNMIIETLRGAA